MKLLIFFATAIFSSAVVSAQINDMYKRKPWEETKYNLLLKDTLNRLFAVPPAIKNIHGKNQEGVYKLPLKGLYLGENGNGDRIYAMQSDRMPCLVPDKSFASNMPVASVSDIEIKPITLEFKNEKKLNEK